MERREQYDPEDIERLLQERGFDELLEEERAYVLRHLSNRDEYEAMRALLHQVREDDQLRAPMAADGDVRDNVLRAFRQEHRPQWRIWLNSVGALLLPREGAAMPMLRPVLAVASVALLITAGVWVAREWNDTQVKEPLAELKPSKQQESIGTIEMHAADEATALNDAEAATESNSSTTAQQPDNPVLAEDAVPPASAELRTAVADAVAEDEAAPGEDLKPVANLQQETKSDGDVLSRDAEGRTMRKEKAAAAAPQSHVVSEAELARNSSVANATGSVKLTKKEAAAPSGLGSLADSPELLAMLTAGW